MKRTRRRALHLLGTTLAVIVLLAPVVYLFGQVWTSTATATATERAALAYARPLHTLLDALVDAQIAASRGRAFDDALISDAVAEVDNVDSQLAGALRIGQRWARLADEIDNALALNTTGFNALNTFGVPIALTQALLGWIADSPLVTSDSPGTYHLMDVAARRLPHVVAATGEAAALASAASSGPEHRLAIMVDRLALAADDIGALLRAGSDRTAVNIAELRLLTPLDQFAAATDELGQVIAQPGDTDSVEAASGRVKAAALDLSTAILDAVDNHLAATAESHALRRQILMLAGALVVLALGALLWLRSPTPAAPEIPAATAPPVGRHGYRPPPPAEAGPELPQRHPNLVDARELLAADVAGRGAGRWPGERRGHNDH